MARRPRLEASAGLCGPTHETAQCGLSGHLLCEDLTSALMTARQTSAPHDTVNRRNPACSPSPTSTRLVTRPEPHATTQLIQGDGKSLTESHWIEHVIAALVPFDAHGAISFDRSRTAVHVWLPRDIHDRIATAVQEQRP